MSVDQIKSASLWVDRTVGNALIKKGIQPNKQTDDFVFVRRVYLDVAGRIPTDVEARDFLNDKDPDKRRKLVDQLLVSDGYRSHLFNWMADLLRHRGKLRRSNFNHYERWLKDQITFRIARGMKWFMQCLPRRAHWPTLVLLAISLEILVCRLIIFPIR